jgi:CheY-like chemotaxis protein
MIDESTAILYIDDDQDDLMIFGDSIGSLYPGITILKAQSGEEGLAILTRLEQSSQPYPSLIVLDMNMPKMDGRQTLQKIKGKSAWMDIPVVIFTTSSNREDIEFCKKYDTECITKPMSYKNLDVTMRQLISHCNQPL